LLRENWLLKKLRYSTKPCIGTWITIPSATSLDIVCSAGPDFVVIDTEHAPIGLETAQTLAMTCESSFVSPVYRVGSTEEVQIVRALETGMHAIQVPNLQDSNTAKAMVRAARYSPMGSKGLSPFTRACGYTGENAKKMVETANENTLLIAQIEGAQGIENIDSILSTPGLDICFLGMFDLSNYLGIPGDLENPKLKQLFASLVKKISDSGRVVGSISNNSEQLRFLIDSGVRYITHSADCDILYRACRDAFAIARA
jgi:4-hydroxy-2-oxoheptanedioate aldolase